MAIGVAKGTKLKIGTDTVAHLTKIGSPSVKWDTVECTALDNTDGFKKYMNTFAEGGEVSVSGYFDYSDKGQKAIADAAANGEDNLACSVVFPAAIGAQWDFTAGVSAFSTSAETAGMVEFEATLKVTGKPELKASSGE